MGILPAHVLGDNMSTVREKFDNIIEIKNVTKVFYGITVVDDVNLAVRRGEFVTLLGPSG